MATQIIPFQFEEATIRTVVVDGDVWWVGKDVCSALGYADTTNAMKQHCRGVVKRHPILDSLGRNQEARILSEPDVMRLMVSSSLPAAERFERWVFEEVLPSIRRTGAYKAERKPSAPVRGPSLTQIYSLYQRAGRDAERAGVPKAVAVSAVYDAVQNATGLDMEVMRLTLPPPEKLCNLNQGQLGQLVGLSKVQIGKLLREHGLLTDEGGNRVVTAAGKEYGVMIPYTKGGHSGYEPRWNKSVLDVIYSPNKGVC